MGDKIRTLVIQFPDDVPLDPDDQRTLVQLADRMCDRWEQDHPGEVMWASEIGFAITSMPMTKEDEEAGVPLTFDEQTFEVGCFARADYHWPCKKCGQEQGDHKDHITQPPAGDCDFEPAKVVPRRRRGPPKVKYEPPTQIIMTSKDVN